MKSSMLIMKLALMLMLFSILNVSASETRVFSMGQTGAFTYDNSNIARFPGTLMRFGNEIVTELRLKDVETQFSAEVRLPVNSDYMVGLNFNRPISVSTPPVGMNVRLTQTSDLYLGSHLGDNDVGVRLSLGRDGFSQDSSGTSAKLDESARYLELAGGISSDIYDAGLSIELPSIKSELGDATDDWSGFGVNVNGRLFHEANDKMIFVPVASAGFSSSSREFDPGNSGTKQETDISTMNATIGAGMQYKINEENLIIVAIDPFGYFKTKSDVKDGMETTITVTQIPRLYLGAEARLKSWLLGRIGANRAYQTQKTTTKPAEGDEIETSQQFSPYNVSFGLGMEIGNFLIDIDINDGLFFEGPNLISGRMRDMANRVSISYLFSNNERSK